MTDKEFDILLQLSALQVDAEEREALMHGVESILGYVSQLPVVEGGGDQTVTAGFMPAGEARVDEVQSDAEEARAVREAFPASVDGLLQVQDVFASKDL